MNLSGKHTLVTGGGTGIALAIEQVLARGNRHSQPLQTDVVAAAALWMCADRSGSVNGHCTEISGGQV